MRFFQTALYGQKRIQNLLLKLPIYLKALKFSFFIISLFARNILTVTETERKTLILRKQKDRLVIV